MSQTFVVTGANRGIGYAVARALCSDERASERRVVLVCRDAHAGAPVRDELSRAHGSELSLVIGALDSVPAIKECARRLVDACPRIDVLIHNAGVWPARRVCNEQGLEQAFVVNHLAPFLLNRLLESTLARSRARVVQVSAGIYVKGKPAPERSKTGEDFSALTTYATSKLYNLALLPLFRERWRPLGIALNAVHPGVIRTGLGDRDDLLGVALKLVKRLWKEPDEAVPPILRLALDPLFSEVSGRYYERDVERELAPIARDRALAETLWRQAERLTGLLDGGAPLSFADSADGPHGTR